MMKFSGETSISDEMRVNYLSAMFNACLSGDGLRRCMGIVNSQKSLWKNSSKIINAFMNNSKKVSDLGFLDGCVFYRYDFIDNGYFAEGNLIADGLNRDLLLLDLSSGAVYSCWHEGGVYLNIKKVNIKDLLQRDV